MDEVCSMHEWDEKYKILKGKPLGRTRHRREDNTGLDLREIGWKGVDSIDLDQNMDQWWALVNMIMNLWIPQKVGNFWTS
jgi:hypothetical protein